MRLARALLVCLPVFAIAAAYEGDASACGGCFVQESESTQVSGHRMVLSVSNDSSTLWDQITYSGDPSSFAWVLPTKGIVEIGLSSDALFETLESFTEVTISSPQITCPPPPDCYGGFGSTGSGANEGSGGGGGGGVEVIAQEVVGPFETVQLSAQDPAALTDWLTSHNYAIPADIVPIIGAYVTEGFNFLALKLVPGQGIDAMRPVRVTTPGASPVLPLRMVAAGTGAVTPISLWVLGEGRYEPTNFPTFEINADELVWNWDESSSNYKELREAGFANVGGLGWMMEAAEPFSTYGFEYSLTSLAQYNPSQSGYADENGLGAEEAVQEDLAKLFGSLSRPSAWINRMYAELPREGLTTDLNVGASQNQSIMPRYFLLSESIGTPPACPTFDPCDEGSGYPTTGSGSPSGGTGGSGQTSNQDVSEAGGGCTMSRTEGQSLFGALGLVLGLSLLRRRRSNG